MKLAPQYPYRHIKRLYPGEQDWRTVEEKRSDFFHPLFDVPPDAALDDWLFAYRHSLTHEEENEMRRMIQECGPEAVFPGLRSTDFQIKADAQQKYRRFQSYFGAWQLATDDRQGLHVSRAQLKQELDEELGGYAERCEQHDVIYHYLKKIDLKYPHYGLSKRAAKMHNCHRSGAAGVHASGKNIIAWDDKCEDSKLCPHSQYKETHRLVESYLPLVIDTLKASRRRRLYYTVLNPPNYAEDKLYEGKRELMEKTKQWTTHTASACPLVMGSHGKYKKKTKPFCLNDCLIGHMVVQEDPLGSNYDWNVHNNLLMLTEGQFDYDLARIWWNEIVFGCKADENKNAFIGFNLIEPTDDDVNEMGYWPAMEKAVRKAMFEIIKYVIATVAAKSLDNDGGAPPLTQWPASLFIEHVNANKSFKRTRSYGCLYAPDRKRWDAEDPEGRYHRFFQPARDRGFYELELDYVYLAFTDIPLNDRNKIRRVIRKPEVFDMSEVKWVGQVKYLDGDGVYCVDISAPNASQYVASLPGDNFFSSATKTDNFSHGPPSRPPPRH